VTRPPRNNKSFECGYSADTEILTEKGWVPFPKLRKSARIAQFDKERGTITFSKYNEPMSFHYRGDMVYYCRTTTLASGVSPSEITDSSQCVSLCCTPNTPVIVRSASMLRRVPAGDPKFRTDVYHYHDDGTVTGSQSKLLLSAIMRKERNRDGSGNMTPLDKLRILYTTFGEVETTNRTNKGFPVKMVITGFSHIWELVEELCIEADLMYTVSYTNKKTRTIWFISPVEFSHTLDWIPFRWLCVAWCDDLYELITKYPITLKTANKGLFLVVSDSLYNLDQLQAVLCLGGYCSFIKKCPPTYTKDYIGLYRLVLRNSHTFSTHKVTIATEPYDGMVYNTNVGYDCIITRRNRIPLISGDSTQYE